MIDCLQNFSLVKLRGFAHLIVLDLVSMLLCYVTVKNVVSVELEGMLRADCSAETRLALHVPRSS